MGKAFADANYKTETAKQQNGDLVPGRQHLPGRRAGRRRGHAAATRQRVRGVRERRHACGQPHVEAKVVDPNGEVGRRPCAPKAIRHVALRSDDARRDAGGLPGRGQPSPTGTAYQAFQGFPLAQVPVAGKTGTAQVAGKGDTSLFVGMFAATPTNPKYIVAVVVEQAGFGAQTAAPIVRQIIEAMNGLPTPPMPPVVAIDTGHD